MVLELENPIPVALATGFASVDERRTFNCFYRIFSETLAIQDICTFTYKHLNASTTAPLLSKLCFQRFNPTVIAVPNFHPLVLFILIYETSSSEQSKTYVRRTYATAKRKETSVIICRRAFNCAVFLTSLCFPWCQYVKGSLFFGRTFSTLSAVNILVYYPKHVRIRIAMNLSFSSKKFWLNSVRLSILFQKAPKMFC